MTLYELTEAYLTFYENEDTSSQIIKDDLEKDFAKKVEGWGKAYRSIQADYEKQKEESDRLKDKMQDTKRKMKAIQDTILGCMLAIGKSQIHTSLFDFSVRSSADTLIIDDETAIPKEFLKPQPPKIDKSGLNKWAKANADKVGEFGHYEPKNSLIIK